MHMARLADPSSGPGEYSLQKLSVSYQKDILRIFNELNKKDGRIESVLNDPGTSDQSKSNIKTYCFSFSKTEKRSMKQIFGYYKHLKNGNLGKVLVFPEVLEMHTNPIYVDDWVEYSCFDAEITYYLREALRYKLLKLETESEGLEHNYNLYLKYWRPFGELLTDMERYGFKINLQYLKKIQIQAENDKQKYEREFLKWVWDNQDDAKEFNPSSAQQMQHMLFAPYFKEHVDQSNRNYEELEEKGDYIPRIRTFRVENLSGEIKEGKEVALKYRDMSITGFGIPPLKYTPSGLPSADTDTIKKIAGDPRNGKFGLAYDYFTNKLDEEEKGKELCFALDNWVRFKGIETLLATFIIPLQRSVGDDGRIH